MLQILRDVCGGLPAGPLRAGCLPLISRLARTDSASPRAGRASVPAAFRNAGSAFPRIPKKIGRAAPAGLGSREKKRYRSPLVSP